MSAIDNNLVNNALKNIQININAYVNLVKDVPQADMQALAGLNAATGNYLKELLFYKNYLEEVPVAQLEPRVDYCEGTLVSPGDPEVVEAELVSAPPLVEFPIVEDAPDPQDPPKSDDVSVDAPQDEPIVADAEVVDPA